MKAKGCKVLMFPKKKSEVVTSVFTPCPLVPPGSPYDGVKLTMDEVFHLSASLQATTNYLQNKRGQDLGPGLRALLAWCENVRGVGRKAR